MRCEICGREFRPSGHGKRQKYCSESCRNKAKYRRRKSHGESDSSGHGETTGTTAVTTLDRREFERMMDDDMETVLRMNRDRLKEAMADPSTPANALPAISRQLISVCERLQGMSDEADLFDEPESTEVIEDVGASIV